MAQLGGVGVQAMLREETVQRGLWTASVKRFMALVVAFVVLTTTAGASAQDAPDDAREAQKARERASCVERLKPLEEAIAKDGRYASGYRDVWVVTAATMVTLSLASAFTVSEPYRRTEGIVGAVQSLLLFIPTQPSATTTTRALDGIRGAEDTDPCLALLSARAILDTNQDDWKLHTNAPAYAIAISIPIVMSGIVAAATGHWDFAVHGNEGVTALVGVALGIVQTLTYPKPSVKMSGVKMAGTSLAVTF